MIWVCLAAVSFWMYAHPLPPGMWQPCDLISSVGHLAITLTLAVNVFLGLDSLTAVLRSRDFVLSCPLSTYLLEAYSSLAFFGSSSVVPLSASRPAVSCSTISLWI